MDVMWCKPQGTNIGYKLQDARIHFGKEFGDNIYMSFQIQNGINKVLLKSHLSSTLL
jgi:hypothetical protein